MQSLNKVTLIGNLGKDPEIRKLQEGKDVATLSVATKESWKDKQTGEWKDKTEWHKVVVFNPIWVKLVQTHLHKGSRVYLEGSLQTRKYTDNQGAEKYSTEIVMSAFSGVMISLDKQEPKPQQPSYSAMDTTGGEEENDIPF